MNVRPATQADLPAILAIYNDAVLHTTATYDEEPETLDSRARWLSEHQAEGYPVLVAERPDAGVVGWSSLSAFRSRVGYRFTAEDSVYVAEGWRGQGIGRSLLEPLLEAARQRGLHAIVAGIDAESEASLRLHASLGFETVARFREVGFKFGRRLDVIFMELIL